jgi:hypothetical protein
MIKRIFHATIEPVTYCLMVLFVSLTLYEIFSKFIDIASPLTTLISNG